MLRRLISLWCGLALLAAPGWAADEEDVEEIVDFEDISEPTFYDSQRYAQVERACNVLVPQTTRKGSVLVVVDHRNQQAVDEEPLHDLLGFDAGGLKIGLGLRCGVLDNLDIGLYRVNGTVEAFDVYEWDVRYRFLAQEDAWLDVAIRPGLTLFSQKGADDATGGFVQLAASRTGPRFRVGAGVIYHSDSSNEVKAPDDDEHSAAAQFFVEVPLTSRFACAGELSAAFSGYRSAHPQFRAGVKYLTHRHTFSVNVSNSQYTSADGIVSNSDADGGDVAIGFTITREAAVW